MTNTYALAVLLAAGVFAGCSDDDDDTSNTGGSGGSAASAGSGGKAGDGSGGTSGSGATGGGGSGNAGSGGDSGSAGTGGAGGAANAVVYALHASPDAGTVDIFAGDAELIDSAAFGALARLEVPAGAYTLDFFPATEGASTRPSGDPAASAMTPELEAGVTYLAIAAGELADDSFELIPLVANFEAAGSGARVRAVHASAGAPAVDVGTVSTPGDIDTPPVIENVEFGDATDGAGLALPAAALTLGIAATGDTATVAEFPLNLTAGLSAFAIAAGKLGATENAFQLIVVNASASPWTATAVANAK
jgi:hypothetical protein